MTRSLPPLAYEGHEKNKLTLHIMLQIIGKIRMEKTPRKNHWWYVTEYIHTTGFTTGPMPIDDDRESFVITLNVLKNVLEVENSKGDRDSFELSFGMTIADFHQNLMRILDNQGISHSIVDNPFDLGIDSSFDHLTEYHHYDPEYVHTLWKVMVWVDAVFKEFSGRFYGKTCPVHLYWHSMDLAVTRFSGKKAPPMPDDARLSDKDAYTHEVISFGFWPGDDDVREPSFYSYTYPSPEHLDREPIQPSAATWNDANGSAMAVLSYADLLKEEDPKAALLDFLESTYQAGAKLAGWDIEKFKVPPLDEL